jgi:hypothetical protein
MESKSVGVGLHVPEAEEVNKMIKPRGVSDALSLSQQMLEKRGYLVLCSARDWKPGEVIHTSAISEDGSVPVVVLQRTDFQDWKAQCDLAGIPNYRAGFPYFFRVVAE